MGDSIRIVEVGPRDGLQNEVEIVPVQARIAFVQRLVDAGCRTVEVGSFVSPRWIPQMAGTALVLSAIAHNVGRSFPVLVPNEQGLDAALAAGAREIARSRSSRPLRRHSRKRTSTAPSRNPWNGCGPWPNGPQPVASTSGATSRACSGALTKEQWTCAPWRGSRPT